ncbi:MAG: methionine--tRNA ligase [Clostridia bacterium]|nr:methionine--tRNA ligase [Clostridia bacterium]
MNIFIGSAWPYANGPLHIGHIAALLAGDVRARYHRLKGDTVCYVSGSDCYGTPVSIRAKKENKDPSEICERYHEDFIKAFDYLGFSYDYYGKTTSADHNKFVEQFHKELYESEYIYESEKPQAYCNTCQKFLTDRFLEGICPKCGAVSRGDQCEKCNTDFQSDEISDFVCSECKTKPEYVNSKHLYIAISKLEKELKELVDHSTLWRKNAIEFTNKYINEGLRDRAITRDLDWGIKIPKEGYENKRIYIWAENVLGYLSTCLSWCHNDYEKFIQFWNNSRHIYVHGKDNVPFHTIILPSLLIANKEGYKLPDEIISSYHLTFEGRKISTSQNWAVWVNDLIGKYNPDAIRYYLIAKGPEKRDADFTWEEFIYSNNSELLGAYGNFINRTLVFIKKKYDYQVPEGKTDNILTKRVKQLFINIGEKIEESRFKEAINEIFEFVRESNKYFDSEKPWITINSDKANCDETIHNCIYIIINLAILLKPFLPISSEKIIKEFNLENGWKEQEVKSGVRIAEPEILFERLEIGD